jgi:hypothetical protein
MTSNYRDEDKGKDKNKDKSKSKCGSFAALTPSRKVRARGPESPLRREPVAGDPDDALRSG